MADWIKMRSSLLTNPKVIRMARELLKDPDFMEWQCPGLCVTGDENATKRHIPVVTRIVVGSLLPTWSAVNDTAARDGIVRHASSRDIDETAGVPGFGKALMAVGWLVELPNDEGVRFVNFEEHNQPQKERALTAKTGAERSKEYRERQKREAEQAASRDAKRDGARDVTGDVTVTSHRNGREEESREEKKNTPPTPKGGFEVPDWIPGKPWADFVAMRRAKGSKTPFTVAAAKGIVAKLEGFRASGIDVGAVLEESVINGWSSVFEPKARQQHGKGGGADWTGSAT